MPDGDGASTDTAWDVFVSYTQTDQPWAEWVADVLESDGFQVLIQAWDFVPGVNWPALVQAGLVRSSRLLAVVSPAYLTSIGGSAEWQALWAADPAGQSRRLIPVRIAPCDPAALGLVGARGWIDLTGLSGPADDATARARVLDGVRAAQAGRVRPDGPFPLPVRDTGGDAPAVPGGVRYPGWSPAVWGLPQELPRNRRFTGRDAELTQLRDRLTRSGPATIVAEPPTSTDAVAGALSPGRRAQTVHGWGGVGKTELAVEYAYRFRSAYDVVWWIRGERPEVAAADLADLATRLGVGVVGDADEAVRAVVEALRTGQPYPRWLVVVVDNAGVPSDLYGLIAAAEHAAGGHLLVTSRNPTWADRTDTLALEVLPRADAVALLRSHLPAVDATDADQLAAILGDLPLAVEQAGAWLASTGMSVADYGTAVGSGVREVLARGVPDRYPAVVAATWNLAVDALGPDDPAVVELLHLCGFLGPEPIPLDIFPLLADLPGLVVPPRRSRWRDRRGAAAASGDGRPVAALAAVAATPVLFGEVVRRVHTAGLATVEPGSGTVTMHRLVQAVLRDHTPPAHRPVVHTTVCRLLSAALAGDIRGNPAVWPRWRQLLPHVLAVLDSQRASVPVGCAEAGWLGDRAATYLVEIGQLDGAIGLHEQALTDRLRVLGPDHPETLLSRGNLAGAYRTAG
ncbi:FxSxx-COOH system tetratricopeptide repeat protein, partial [Frankia sp. CiP3]|uniref:FxSxx-COOH system tetratricopeptide repeat protein n=1 Tax=Frankia sp. CiP3 TaxID=2880971 RepID=UPI001EF3D62B